MTKMFLAYSDVVIEAIKQLTCCWRPRARKPERTPLLTNKHVSDDDAVTITSAEAPSIPLSFANLPTSIRLRIWRASIEPRAVTFRAGGGPPLGVFSACQESRAETRFSYMLERVSPGWFPGQYQTVFINYNIDVVNFLTDIPCVSRTSSWRGLDFGHKAITKKLSKHAAIVHPVRKLLLSVAKDSYAWSEIPELYLPAMSRLWHQLEMFRNLEEVTFVLGGDKQTFTDTLTYWLVEDEQYLQEARELSEDMATIKAIIQSYEINRFETSELGVRRRIGSDPAIVLRFAKMGQFTL